VSWCDVFGDGFELDSCFKGTHSVFIRLSNGSEVCIEGRDRIRAIGESLVELADTHTEEARRQPMEIGVTKEALEAVAAEIFKTRSYLEMRIGRLERRIDRMESLS
jgi:hypothetical protein